MHTGQLFTLLIIALALGMDAFSLGVGIGMRGIRLRDIIKLSVDYCDISHRYALDGHVYGPIRQYPSRWSGD